VKRFRGGLVFKAHRLLYHSTLGLRVIKKKKGCGSTSSREGGGKNRLGTAAHFCEVVVLHAPSSLDSGVREYKRSSGDKSHGGIGGITLHSHVH